MHEISGKVGIAGAMKFRKIKGKKKEGDEILLVKTEGCDGWEAVKLIDIAKMVVFKYQNEDFLYPPPRFQGGQMVLNFLRDCIKEPDRIDFIATKYKLTKGVEVKLHHFV